jgi:Spy/CpxP family protein refolding chaperone
MDHKVLVVTLVGIAVLGLLAFTGCRKHASGMHGEMAIDYLTESLDLDEAQQDQLQRYRNEIMQQAMQMRSGKKQIMDELAVQVKSEVVDRQKLKDAVAQHRVQMVSMIDLVINRLADFHSTLSPEQKEKLVTKLEKFEKWHHNGCRWRQ